MNVKGLLFLPALLLLFMVNCATGVPGERLKKTDMTKYNTIVGNWYILSNDEPCKIIYTITFNDDGTITDDSKFFGENTRWSEIKTSSYALDNYFTIYNPNKYTEYRTTNSGDKSTHLDGGVTLFYNADKLDQSNPYSTYMSLVNTMRLVYSYNEESKVFVYVRDINTLNILKEKIAIDKTDNDNNYKIFVSNLDKNFNKGKFGGGYQNYKWGTKESEIVTLLGNPKSKSNDDDKNLTALNYSFDDKDIQFTFYNEALFEIVVSLNSDDDTIFQNLKDKYGKPKMTTSYDTNYVGAWKSNITYNDYNWSDGITNIRVRYAKTSSICENCNNQYSYTPKLQEAWVSGIVYQSNVIAKYIKKLEDDEETNEKNKERKKLKDNL